MICRVSDALATVAVVLNKRRCYLNGILSMENEAEATCWCNATVPFAFVMKYNPGIDTGKGNAVGDESQSRLIYLTVVRYRSSEGRTDGHKLFATTAKSSGRNSIKASRLFQHETHWIVGSLRLFESYNKFSEPLHLGLEVSLFALIALSNRLPPEACTTNVVTIVEAGKSSRRPKGPLNHSHAKAPISAGYRGFSTVTVQSGQSLFP